MLTDYERERYKEPVRESLKALLALGWTVEHQEVDVPLSHRGSTRRTSKPTIVCFFSFPVFCTNFVQNFLTDFKIPTFHAIFVKSFVYPILFSTKL